LDLGVDAKVTEKLINKGISLIASKGVFLKDLYNQIKSVFIKEINKAFVRHDENATDDADYLKMSDDAVKEANALGRAIEVIETKGKGIGLKFDDSIENIVNSANESFKASIMDKVGSLSNAEPTAETNAEPTANEISEKFIKGVMEKVTEFKFKPDDLTLGNVQVINILKDLGNSILTAEKAKNSVVELMNYKSGSLGSEAFKPVGEYQGAVKNALYTCANYLKSGKHVNNCFSRLKEDKLIKAVKQEAKGDACYYKMSEKGDGQFVNLHIKFSDEGYPSYNAEKTANAGRECIEIQDNAPLELLAIAEELTIDN
jgi:hypothetical protein